MKVGGGDRLRSLVSQSAITFAIKCGAAFAAFLLQIVVARRLGAEGAGFFFLAVTLIIVLSTIARCGMDVSMLRMIPVLLSESKSGSPRSLLSIIMMRLLLPVSLLLAGLLFITAHQVATSVFGKPGLADIIKITAPALPAATLTAVVAMALNGLGQQPLGMVTLSLIMPALASLAIFLLPNAVLTSAAGLYSLCCWISLFFGLIAWLIVTRKESEADVPNNIWGTTCAIAPRLWLITNLQIITLWSPTLLLAVWVDAVEVGIFNAAARTAMLTSFILVAVNSVVAPRFASMHAIGNRDGMAAVLSDSVKLLIAIAVPVIISLLICGRWIMAIFGPEFAVGYPILVALSLAQFVNLATGSVGYLLTMTGNEAAMTKAVAFAAGGGLVLALVLIPMIGIWGAVLSASFMVVFQNLLAVRYARMLVGISILGKKVI